MPENYNVDQLWLHPILSTMCGVSIFSQYCSLHCNEAHEETNSSVCILCIFQHTNEFLYILLTLLQCI